jgi:DnaK suppressor protein
MAQKTKSKKKPEKKPVAKAKPAVKSTPAPTAKPKPVAATAHANNTPVPAPKRTPMERGPRYESLHRMLMAKRHETMSEIEGVLGRSLTEDQQRRLEAAMDVGDQALMDLDRELGISLMEMRNKKRQSIDDALRKLDEGTYGICEECGIEISERRLAAVPFAKLCVECQSKQELLEKIVRGEERD